MSRQRYTEEFKLEAVKQVTERGHPVAEVATRLGVSGYSLYQWIKRYAKPAEHRKRASNPTCTGLTQAGKVSFHCQGSSASRLSSSPSLGRVSNANCR